MIVDVAPKNRRRRKEKERKGSRPSHRPFPAKEEVIGILRLTAGFGASLRR
jgi:hypothetical protein